MNFKKWVISIQTAGYNGARTVDQNSIRNAIIADYYIYKKKTSGNPLKKQQCKFCGKKFMKTCRESIIILDLIRIAIKIE